MRMRGARLAARARARGVRRDAVVRCCGVMRAAVRRCSSMSQSSARSWKGTEGSPKVSSTQSICNPCALTEARKRRKLSTLFWWRPGLKKVEMPMNLPGGRFVGRR